MPKPAQALGLSLSNISCSVAVTLVPRYYADSRAISVSSATTNSVRPDSVLSTDHSWRLPPENTRSRLPDWHHVIPLSREADYSISRARDDPSYGALSLVLLRHGYGIVCLSGGFTGLIVLESRQGLTKRLERTADRCEIQSNLIKSSPSVCDARSRQRSLSSVSLGHAPNKTVYFYMNVQEQIKKYITSQPEPKRSDMQDVAPAHTSSVTRM